MNDTPTITAAEIAAIIAGNPLPVRYYSDRDEHPSYDPDQARDDMRAGDR